MKAGKLDRRVRFEFATEIDDGYNTTLGWAKLTDAYCQYIPSAGKEAREAAGQAATMPATFIVRYRSALVTLLTDTGKYRLRFPAGDDGQVFDIKSAVNPDRRESIHITALASDAGPA